MKFIAKFVLIYLVITVIVLGISGVISYFIIRDEISKELKWQFLDHIDRVTYLLEEGKEFANEMPATGDENLVICKLDHAHENMTTVTDTMVWDDRLEQNEPNVKVETIRNINGNSYYIATYGAMIESDDVQEAVIKILLWILALQTAGAVGVGFVVSGRLFKPFQNTLDKIKKFRLQDKQYIEAQDTGVKEFDELNKFVEMMTKKAVADYINLKEFAENASHELQTPLAIAKGKLELLTETELNTEQYKFVDNIQRNISKLSKLSSSLALLTKIENQEFDKEDETNFSKIVKEGIEAFHEFAELNRLELETDIEDNVSLKINSMLAEILWNNLFQNAIWHNNEDGEIRIKLTGDHLLIKNTGTDPGVNPMKLFERFRKADQSSGSIGLGLSIIKRIADLSGFQIHYNYESGWHSIKIIFSK